MQHEYQFSVYSRRWGHEDTYRIKKLDDGWHIGFKAHTGNCNREGSPILEANFRQDSINYPANIGFYMEWIWGDLHEKRIDDTEVQLRLQQLADWVSDIERSTPDTLTWKS